MPWWSERLKIRSVSISNGITAIGNYAFCTCRNLKFGYLPGSVTKIGDYAFHGCVALIDVEVWENTQIGRNAFPSLDVITHVIG